MTTLGLSSTPLVACSVLWVEKNHPDCYEVFRDSVTGIKHHPMISPRAWELHGKRSDLLLYFENRALWAYLTDSRQKSPPKRGEYGDLQKEAFTANNPDGVSWAQPCGLRRGGCRTGDPHAGWYLEACCSALPSMLPSESMSLWLRKEEDRSPMW